MSLFVKLYLFSRKLIIRTCFNSAQQFFVANEKRIYIKYILKQFLKRNHCSIAVLLWKENQKSNLLFLPKNNVVVSIVIIILTKNSHEVHKKPRLKPIMTGLTMRALQHILNYILKARHFVNKTRTLNNYNMDVNSGSVNLKMKCVSIAPLNFFSLGPNKGKICLVFLNYKSKINGK